MMPPRGFLQSEGMDRQRPGLLLSRSGKRTFIPVETGKDDKEALRPPLQMPHFRPPIRVARIELQVYRPGFVPLFGFHRSTSLLRRASSG